MTGIRAAFMSSTDFGLLGRCRCWAPVARDATRELPAELAEDIRVGIVLHIVGERGERDVFAEPFATVGILHEFARQRGSSGVKRLKTDESIVMKFRPGLVLLKISA